MTIKHNFQIRFILRLFLMIIIAIGMMCVGAVWLGTHYPTQLILVEAHVSSQQTDKLILIDINRKLSVYYPLPAEYQRLFVRSSDGRRVIILSGTGQLQPMVWDIFTGRRVYLSDAYPNCLVEMVTWLRDSRHVAFSCQTNIQGGMMGGINLLDFETGAVNLFYSQSQVLHYSQWSPDLTRIGINVNNSVRVVSADGTQELFLTPPNVWQRFLGWSADAESVLVYGLDTIQRYTFSTDTWETLLSDVAISERPIISPDGEWIAIISGLGNARVSYAFNLLTLELIPLTSPEMDIVGVNLLTWSPDSQWLLVRVSDGRRNPQYIAKPDASDIRLIANDIADVVPQWSPDATRMVYHISEWDGKDFHSFAVVWDILSDTQTSMYSIQFPQWSLNGDRLAFIRYDDADQSQSLYLAENGVIHALTGVDLYVSGFIFVK